MKFRPYIDGPVGQLDSLFRYNLKLDLASCRTMDAKTVAFRLMDVAVTSHSGCDKSTAMMDRVANFIRVSIGCLFLFIPQNLLFFSIRNSACLYIKPKYSNKVLFGAYTG